jgi:hypothetical protein
VKNHIDTLHRFPDSVGVPDIPRKDFNLLEELFGERIEPAQLPNEL